MGVRKYIGFAVVVMTLVLQGPDVLATAPPTLQESLVRIYHLHLINIGKRLRSYPPYEDYLAEDLRRYLNDFLTSVLGSQASERALGDGIWVSIMEAKDKTSALVAFIEAAKESTKNSSSDFMEQAIALQRLAGNIAKSSNSIESAAAYTTVMEMFARKPFGEKAEISFFDASSIAFSVLSKEHPLEVLQLYGEGVQELVEEGPKGAELNGRLRRLHRSLELPLFSGEVSFDPQNGGGKKDDQDLPQPVVPWGRRMAAVGVVFGVGGAVLLSVLPRFGCIGYLSGLTEPKLKPDLVVQRPIIEETYFEDEAKGIPSSPGDIFLGKKAVSKPEPHRLTPKQDDATPF